MPRNGSGTYSLPTGNPVVSGTTIEASWANNTMSDIGSEITNSLARTGAGGMTGPLRLSDGSSTVPGAAWANETTSGFYRAGAADMRLVVTTAEIQKWVATGTSITGTLGVSGTSTFAALNASGNVSFDGGTFVFNESGADKDARFEGDTDANLLFTDASTDRVGIGTNSPTAKIDVRGSATFNEDGADVDFRVEGDTDATLIFADASVDRVGIGSNAPAYKLDVVVGTAGDGIYLQRAGSQKFSALGDGTVNWSAGSDGGQLSWDTGKAIVTSNSGATLAFRTNATATDRILIDTSGNVGIGQASPGSALDVKGTLRLSGSSSGYVGLAPAAAAGSTTYTLPAADGTSGQFLSTNGSGTLSWGSSSPNGAFRSMQVYTSTGANTWTKPAGLVRVKVTVVAAGGGGGGCAGVANAVAGGGGGGGASIKMIEAASLGATETATVGAGGTAGSNNGITAGGAGGSSSFGSHCSATGGGGGSSVSGAAAAAPGAGGSGSSGNINLNGNCGLIGVSVQNHGGSGGGSPFGGGGYMGLAGGGTNGANGGGGGGAASGGSAYFGGTGGNGFIVVEEFF